jgi:hypothetical protein
MSLEQCMSEPTFKGNVEQRALAAQIFRIMAGQGAMFAADAPIRQTLSNLAEFFAAQKKAEREAVASEIDAALRANDAVFTRQEQDGEVIYVTTRSGAWRPRDETDNHTFRQRLYEPENPLPVDDISVVVTTTRPALTTVEPVFVSDYWQRQAGLLPPEAAEDEAPVEVEAALAAQPAGDATPAAEAAEVPVELPAPVAPGTVMTLPNGVQIDLRRPVAELMAQYGPSLTAQLRAALENDPLRRIVSFGNSVFPEAAVVSFGKNDLRRIRDYIMEVGEPLLDTQIIADVFYHNPRQPDYEAFRFALNYRLSREKDFEFVGVEGARMWSVKGLASIGSKRVKASEMGQLAGYLEEGFDDSLEGQSADAIRKSGTLTHTLSFFEWEYGILPLTRALAALLPPPLLPDQRTAILRIESPQHFTAYLAELRYPTGNRGGWISGLEEFFHEYLVAGALITLARTDDPHTFTISYDEQPEETERLLVLDEKKNKLAFDTITFTAVVDPDRLLTQASYGRLRNLKVLPMSERRKGEVVLEEVFETIGEPVGTRAEPRYEASVETLLIALNVLRPASKSYLLHLLRDGEHFKVEDADAGIWSYSPPVQVTSADEDEDEDDYYDDEE